MAAHAPRPLVLLRQRPPVRALAGADADRPKSENDLSFDAHRRRRLIVGSPQDCIEQIEECRELLGITYPILSFRQSSGPSYEQELECLRRFGAEVIPAFK